MPAVSSSAAGHDRIRSIDAEQGEAVCGGGVSLRHLMEVLLPLGWFVPVVPGSGAMTVGGAIEADLHGRNHHMDGSFTRHVRSMELLTPDGAVRTLTPEGTPDLFRATSGGMGLTGVVRSATVRLLPVETSLVSVDTERAKDLDDLMGRLTAADHRYRYSVAWIDLLARGTATGRAVLTRGAHAPLDALPARSRRAPLAFRPGRLPARPRFAPHGLLGRTAAGRTAVGIFNELWYRKAPRSRTGELRRIRSFFHPLDGVPQWNRIYGRAGFVRYRLVVGYDEDDALRRIIRRVSRRGCPAVLAVLKRFGTGDPGWLSFPMAGWALTLDIPSNLPGLDEFLDGLGEEVAGAGGRICVSEDFRLRPELLGAMYPRLAEFRALRAELDPGGVLAPDLARRLGL
ncbi:FAD-binding oxidoreductase [Streptomyces sp. NPDC004647]|uniref:FAD-binding oxidoreductase n=1 Tax=Streptomyces sp. NPDC004647 TaxID=3154671 RepID=UPI0033B7599D